MWNVESHTKFNAPTGGISSPLHGLNVGFQSAHILASTMDTMQREKGVKLLNFSYIKLNKTQMLGEGSFSRVYRGTYKRRECAIKMIFTFDLTADEIRRVAAESQILSSLKHPNIIGKHYQLLVCALIMPLLCPYYALIMPLLCPILRDPGCCRASSISVHTAGIM